MSESKYLTARSLAFWEDADCAKLSIVTEELGHLYIKISEGQARLLAPDLTTFVFRQIEKDGSTPS